MFSFSDDFGDEGEPLWEQVSPEHATSYLYDESGVSEGLADQLVTNNVNATRKRLEKTIRTRV